MKNLNDIIDDYLAAIEAAGSLTPKVLQGPPDDALFEQLAAFDEVTVFPDLRTYFTRLNGYDIHACSERDLFEPELAWGMFAYSLEDCIAAYDDLAGIGGDENPDYWPYGFVPILDDGAGSSVLVNCIAGSPTFGAVYEMTDCVGVNRVSDSLADFLLAATHVVKAGWKTFDRDTSSITVGDDEYADLLAQVHGNTPYFTGRGSDQVVDWK